MRLMNGHLHLQGCTPYQKHLAPLLMGADAEGLTNPSVETSLRWHLVCLSYSQKMVGLGGPIPSLRTLTIIWLFPSGTWPPSLPCHMGGSAFCPHFLGYPRQVESTTARPASLCQVMAPSAPAALRCRYGAQEHTLKTLAGSFSWFQAGPVSESPPTLLFHACAHLGVSSQCKVPACSWKPITFAGHCTAPSTWHSEL